MLLPFYPFQVGDPNQLPPVGAGSVLQDCVSSGAFVQVQKTEK